MAEKFVLTAQLRLQAPKNTRQVANQIRNDLKGVSVDVQLKNASQTTRSVRKINSELSKSTKLANGFGQSLALATKRAAGLAVATRVVSTLTTRFSNAVGAALDFERELIKVSQVTGKTLGELKGLSAEITKLSTTLGVSSQSLVLVSRQLSQAGFAAGELRVALAALAKTELAPTFEDISKTAEGAIAIFNQFKQGAGALEAQLGAINAVAGQFAVESGDLISAVRRTGGVFRAAGGELNELLALFTSVRATTRESSESIATGLRTIFTRIQRPRTIQFLEDLGVSLKDAEGKFVGPLEAVKRLNEEFGNLPQGDIRFIQLSEEIAGFRQIGKVIPLIQEFGTAQEALRAAQEGQNSLNEDTKTGLQSLAQQFQKVREEYLALVRNFADGGAFRTLADTALTLLSALAKILDKVNDLGPALLALGGIKLFQSGALAGLAGGLGRRVAGRNQGGPIGFNRGGVVPGTGNRDTVPAMLTPGEFVIRKSSVGKIGADTLAQMNENRFNRGGQVRLNPGAIGVFGLARGKGQDPDSFVDVSGRTVTIKNPDILNKYFNKPGTKTELSKAGNKNLLLSKNKAGQAALLGINEKDFNKLTKSSFDSNNALKKRGAGTALKQAFAASLDSKSEVGKRFATTARNVTATLQGSIKTMFPGVTDLKKNAEVAEIVKRQTQKGLFRAVEQASGPINKALSIIPQINFNPKQVQDAARRLSRDPNAAATTQGFVYEGAIDGITGATLGGDKVNFDFNEASISAGRDRLQKMFGPGVNTLVKADAKRSITSKTTESLVNKIQNDINKGLIGGLTFLNSGGGISGQDTVPALLTPGEFVINKEAASRIGSANLNRMNKQGVTGFNKGGPVGIQRFTNGGKAQAGGGDVLAKIFALQAIPSLIETFATSVDESGNKIDTTGSRLASAFSGMAGVITQTLIALTAFNVQLTAGSIKSFFGGGKGGFGDKIGGFTRKNPGRRIRDIRSRKDFKETFAGQRRKGESFVEGFRSPNLKAQRSARAAELRQLRTQRNSGLLGKVQSFDRIEALKANKLNRLPRSLTGNLGRFAGRIPGAGAVGKVAGFAGRAATAIPGVSGLAGALGPVIGGLTAFAGPLALAATAAGLVSAGFTALFNAQGEYEKAIEEGNIEEAQKQAVLKNTSGITQALDALFSTIGLAGEGGFAGGITNLFANLGFGETTNSIKAQAKAAALVAKADREKEKATRKATEALEDFADGTKTTGEAFSAIGTQNLAQFEAVEAQKDAAEAKRAEKGGGTLSSFSGFARTVSRGFGLFGETAGQRNARLEKEAKGLEKDAEKRQKAAFQQTKGQIGQVLRTAGNVEDFDSLQDFINSTDASDEFKQQVAGFDKDQQEQLKRIFDKEKKIRQDNLKALESLNFGLRGVNAKADTQISALDRLDAAASGEGTKFTDAASVLRDAISSGAKNISASQLQGAQDVLRQSLADFGATPQQADKVAGSINTLNKAQTGLSGILEEIKSDTDIRAENLTGQKIVDELGSRLVKQAAEGGDADSARRLQDSFKNLSEQQKKDIQDAFKTGNFGKVADLGLEPLKKATEEQLEILEKRNAIEKKLQKFIEKRLEAENQFVQAQQRSTDLQLEASKLIAEARGTTVNTQQQFLNRLEKFNLQAQSAGLQGATTGSAADITRVGLQILSRDKVLSNQQFRGGRVGTVDAETKEERERLSQTLEGAIGLTKDRINLIKEEISILERKNALERRAVDALLSGDREGFIKAQQASVAAEALRENDQATLAQLNREAIAEGLRSLQGQGLSSAELEKAARDSGLLNREQAKIFAKTTDRQNELNNSLSAAAQALSNLGKIGEGLKEIQVEEARIILNRAEDLTVKQFENNRKKFLEEEKRLEDKAEKARQANLTQIQKTAEFLVKAGRTFSSAAEKIFGASQSLGSIPETISVAVQAIPVDLTGGAALQDQITKGVNSAIEENLRKLLKDNRPGGVLGSDSLTG